VELTDILVVLAAIPAVAQQPPAQFGHRLGSSIAFLTHGPDIEEPGRPEAILIKSAESLRAFMQDQLRARMEQLANGNGADIPLVKNPDGSTTPLLVSPRPSAAFETWAEQQSSDYAESAKTGFAGIERTEGKAILRRFVRDDLRQIYVSYEVTVEILPDGTYRVNFGPSSSEPPADLRAKADWKLQSPARYPVPQIMKDGDAIRLELYSNNGRRVVDYIHVGRQDRMVIHTQAPHDSYAGDAELTITQPSFRVNGVGATAVGTPETIRGSSLWVYVPGHGRYILSLQAHTDLGFESAGEVAGSSLMFTEADGNVIRIDSAGRIASGSGTYLVHVLPDASWMPADAQDRGRVTIGAAPWL
jgi:hypothetical protein